jgi:hypothetical protein
MEAPLDTPRPLRYAGAERRLSRGERLGDERRRPDPATEQDHPELYEPQAEELQE